MFTKFLNLPIFICSFIIGIVFVQLSSPSNTVIFVYPTPDNIEHLVYKDKADNCFSYNVDNIKCPKDRKHIKTIPVQMGAAKREKSIQPHKIGHPQQIGQTTINKI